MVDYSFLNQTILKYTNNVIRYDSPIKGLSFHRSDYPTEPLSYMFAPHLCLITQGVKHITLGEEDYIYDNNSFVLSSIDLPLISKIIQASKEKPYLGITLEIDLEEIAKIITEINFTSPISQNNRGIGVSKLSPQLFDAMQRLIKLLDNPHDIAIMTNIIKKEIYYRLLIDSNEGYKLKELVSLGSNNNKIAKTITWIKDNFNQPLKVPELSNSFGMSDSSLYHHFKLLTGISPLQYQKRIRLNEAKKLMLVDNLPIGEAAFNVGYESLTQFSREYKRFFGKPPSQDIKQLQNNKFG